MSEKKKNAQVDAPENTQVDAPQNTQVDAPENTQVDAPENTQVENTEKASENVKVVVKQVFRDKFNTTIYYKVGQELEVDADRAKDIVTRGLAEYVESAPVE